MKLAQSAQQMLAVTAYSLFLLLLALTFSIVNAWVGPQTTYDGVTRTVFNNSYLNFDGNTGIYY